jgi:hypothetical protein
LSCFYDFETQELALEGKDECSWKSSGDVFPGLTLNSGLKIRLSNSRKPDDFPYLNPFGEKSYLYYCTRIYLKYRLAIGERARIGVSYGGGSGPTGNDSQNCIGTNSGNLIFVAVLACSDSFSLSAVSYGGLSETANYEGIRVSRSVSCDGDLHM